ncbi:uncharacterized protein LOC132196189 [Neocloeon triangulifer]|uniref:uncharacterized protein LOC132196189 n=2 Tax=Neocloeon triangulifer TaxID=2078957 RepID=UPI00286F85F1|nr:uncharacterized protein LOC132196189 [Neocloeon triangulifer]
MAVASPTKNIFPTSFNTICVESSTEKIVLRAMLQNESDANQWKEDICAISRSQWTVLYERDNLERFVVHKKWYCHFSKLNKTENSTRSTDCKAKLDIKIKLNTRNTRNKDKYIRPDKNGISRPAVITITGVHNHHLRSADTLRLNRVPKSLEDTFMSYFDDGNTPAQARRLHEDLLVSADAMVDLADNAHNPTRRCVHHMHEKWSKKNFGGQSDSPLMKIIEKNENNYYLERDTQVYVTVKDENWAVLVVTPIMKRVQHLESAKESLFVDSTSSVDVTHCTLTSMTVPSKAGALPLCLLLHNGQSEDCYKLAFSLVKDHCPKAFGGNTEPLTTMTDDSSAERGALAAVWPSSRQLLCTFHVLSKEWKWLLSNSTKDVRKKLMGLFYKVVYAANQEEFDKGVDEIQSLKSEKKFVARFEKYLKRKNEWAIYKRSDLLLRNNHTNNYAESSIKIVKEAVLDRMKAFNPVALVEFVIGPMESYYKRRLLDHAHNRHSAHSIVFHKLLSRMEKIKPESIKQIEEFVFSVPSANRNGTFYEVHSKIGVCSCPVGEGGAFCKHQSLLVKYFNISMPSAPPLLSGDRLELARLALGSKCPDLKFFLGRTEVDPTEKEPNLDVAHFVSDAQVEFDEELHACEIHSEEQDLDPFDEAEKEDLVNECKDAFASLIELAKTDASNELLRKLSKALNKPKSAPAATASIVAIYRQIGSVCSRSGRIPIQSSGRARRRKGVSKGAAQVPQGRPPKIKQHNTPEVQKSTTNQGKRKVTPSLVSQPKRQRNLSQAVRENVANAKSH